MNLTAPQKNALHGLDMLLRLSQVRVTRTTLRDKLGQHPDFPSLISLSDTLNELKVDNIAAHLTPEQLPEIPLPALAYLDSEGGFFAPVRTTAADAVEWYHTKRGWQKDSLAEFNQKWNGVTLLIEPTEQSGEANYASSRKKQLVESLRLPFGAVSLLVCLSVWAGVYHAPLATALPYSALLLVYAAGLTVSGLLVWYGLDADNPFLRSICQLNAYTNCGAVLNTSAARLFNWLSWAEIGLFYFGGSLLALLFFQTNPAALYPLLLGLSLAALPYTFWSVYYQWRRARQWCVLCLAVQGLLWLEFGVLLYFQRRFTWPAGFNGSDVALLLTSFLLLPALWALLKPIWSKALRTDDLQRSLQKIKFDPGYIESLGRRARTLPPIFTGMRVPTLGDTEALHSLVIVTSPTCSLCAKMHLEVETLIAELEDVRCQFVIAVSNRPGDTGGAVASYVLNQPEEEMLLALSEWYVAPNLRSWLKKVTPMKLLREDDSVAQINLHRHWCELAGINSTPTIFLDGIEIPRHYTTSEIKKVASLLNEKVAKIA